MHTENFRFLQKTTNSLKYTALILFIFKLEQFFGVQTVNFLQSKSLVPDTSKGKIIQCEILKIDREYPDKISRTKRRPCMYSYSIMIENLRQIDHFFLP